MMIGKPDSHRPENDAEAIEEKFGPDAELYAKSRSEAAEMAGNDDGKEHWERVADVLRDG